ncbi:MAG: BrnT family toxin [Nitrospirae bacterium]|nr:BrnT family toxin [Magnetococcales bacterium]
MVDFEKITGFDWDQGNQRKNADKHGVSRSETEQVFFNDPLLPVEDVCHSQSEKRIHALGKTNTGRVLHVVFTLRNDETLIRIISARDMHKKERLRYGREASANPQF